MSELPEGKGVSVQEKVCPLLNVSCLGKSCALWVSLQKSAPNPVYRMVFEGCGLINHVPWRGVKNEGFKDG